MKVICIGRNYADHVRELKSEFPAEPVFFMKPDSSILPKKNPFFYPGFTKDLHYEVEVIVRINKAGKHIAEKFANRYYSEIGLGIDFTARDIQQECKQKGLPWEKAKAFDGSAVVGDFISVDEIHDLSEVHFSLRKNGEVVQNGYTGDMIFPVDRLIAYISQFVTLKIGDLIYTGTPHGVGPVNIGDTLEGFLGEQSMFEVKIR